MKYRAIIFTFPQPLTEHQHNIFVVNMKKVVEGVKEQLQKVVKGVDTNWAIKMYRRLPMYGFMLDLFKNQATIAQGKLSRYVSLEQPTENCYWFIYVAEELQAIHLKKFGREIKAGRMIHEDKFLNALKQHVFPEMGLDPAKVKIEFKEIERE